MSGEGLNKVGSKRLQCNKLVTTTIKLFVCPCSAGACHRGGQKTAHVYLGSEYVMGTHQLGSAPKAWAVFAWWWLCLVTSGKLLDRTGVWHCCVHQMMQLIQNSILVSKGKDKWRFIVQRTTSFQVKGFLPLGTSALALDRWSTSPLPSLEGLSCTELLQKIFHGAHSPICWYLHTGRVLLGHKMLAWDICKSPTSGAISIALLGLVWSYEYACQECDLNTSAASTATSRVACCVWDVGGAIS